MSSTEQPLSGPPAELCLPHNLRPARLRRAEAAQYLSFVHGIRISKNTLAKWGCKGGRWAGKVGGPYYNPTPQGPLYPRDELDKWAATYLGGLVRTTSDSGPA